METYYIDVGNGSWCVLVCTDYNTLLHGDDIWAILRSFGMSNRKAEEALRVLSQPNTGMAVSNDDIRMSVIFVSDATSNDEYWDTMSHEVMHVVTAIIDYYNKPYNGEDAAHLNGYLTKKIVQQVGEPCY